MRNEFNELAATDGGAGDVLERATAALRNAPTPDGPPPLVAARTAAALAKTHPIKPAGFWGGAWLRVAAAVVILGSLAAVLSVAGRKAAVALRTPGDAASPVNQTQPDDPQAPIVQPPPVPEQPRRPVVVRVPLSEPSPQDYPGRFARFEPEPATFASIIGTVYFDGPAPQPAVIDVSASPDCAAHHPGPMIDDSLLVRNARLANVVVSIAPAAGQDLPARVPLHPVVLDQRGCRFVPRAVTAMVGQEMIVKNSDPFLHNVHSNPLHNEPFNFGQPSLDERGRRLDTLKLPERFAVACDLHPWMRATVSVFEHPYFTVSSEDGTFEIPTTGLKDGAYTLVAWHERLGSQQARVIVSEGKAGSVTFHYAIPTTASAADAALEKQTADN